MAIDVSKVERLHFPGAPDCVFASDYDALAAENAEMRRLLVEHRREHWSSLGCVVELLYGDSRCSWCKAVDVLLGKEK